MSKKCTITKAHSGPPIIRLIGILIMAGSIFLAYLAESWAIVGFFLALLFFIPKRTKELDLSNRRFRVALHLGNRVSGKWKAFPKEMDYISIVQIKQKSTIHTTVGVNSMSATNVYTDFQLSFIHQGKKVFKLFTAGSLNEALEDAKCMADALDLDVLTVRPGQKEWIRRKEK